MKKLLSVGILLLSVAFLTSCYSVKINKNLMGEWKIEYLKGDPLNGVKQSILFGKMMHTGEHKLLYIVNGKGCDSLVKYELTDNDSIKFNLAFDKTQGERYNICGVVIYREQKLLRKKEIVIVGKRSKMNATEETEFVMLMKRK